MLIKTATLSSILGATALAILGQGVHAADMKATDMKAADKPAGEKCHGVAKAAKNDCAAGVHSCAGQATKNFDKSSFVLLPAGICAKLAGGALTAMAK